MRLVVGEASERVVVDVAVRGDAVRVAFRTPGEEVAASLHRNAELLAASMRDRGLDLTQLTSGHAPPSQDGDRRRPRREAAPPAAASASTSFGATLDAVTSPQPEP
ncbi:MAG: flagellar hook-length control protein FliK [Kofleriaceae bacterium]